MDENSEILNTGLRGITIASTRISDVDGVAGKLIYRGYLVKDLASRVCFEETAYLLLYEKLPNQAELEVFKARLSKEMAIPSGLLTSLKSWPKDALPMDVLQSAIAILSAYDPDIKDQSREASLRIAGRLIAKTPTIIAAWDRIRNGRAPVEPDHTLNHAANFLYMLSSKVPDEEVSGFFDVALILHAEHTFNASTFAAREIASTRAHMYAAISAAIGSLSGELHGGANVRVMEMLLKIDTPDAVEPYVKHILDTGGKIFGLGHAVYQTDDPRAHILAPMARTMGERIGETKWFEISELLEKTGKDLFKQHKGTEIYVNVDFYSASLYYAMGIPLDLFTPIFALSRVSGWAAHVLEEQFAGAAPKPVLYRPESEYIGDYCGPDVCEFIPMDNR